MTGAGPLPIGARVVLGSHRFEADSIRRFARAYDPQPFHLDEEAARASHFGGLCASGWHTAAVCMRLIVEHNRKADEAAARGGNSLPERGVSPGVANLRWLKPVLAGDTITFAMTPTAVRATASRPGWGLFFAEIEGVNQRGERVYSFESRAFGRMGAATDAAPETGEPT